MTEILNSLLELLLEPWGTCSPALNVLLGLLPRACGRLGVSQGEHRAGHVSTGQAGCDPDYGHMTSSSHSYLNTGVLPAS
jgi:hypothetical protein